jgi:PAS domain S-box-containing protein
MDYTAIKGILSRFFVGKNQDIAVENRLFIATVVIGEIIALTGIILNLVFATGAWELIGICSAVLAAVFVMHYFIRYKRIYEPFKVPVAIIAFTGMAGIWLNSNGLDVPTILMAMVLLVLNLAGVVGRKKIAILSLFVIMLFAVYFVEMYKDAPVYVNPPDHSAWRDGLITNLCCAAFIFMIGAFAEREYNAEKRRAEKSERKFQSLAENSQDFIIRFDRNHRLTYVNHAWKDSSGHIGDIVTMHEIGFFSKEQRAIGEDMLEKAFITGEPLVAQFSKSLSTGMIYYNCRFFPEFDASKNVVSVLGVFRDITELKNSELELMKLNTNKDKFISTLAHDLKSPFQTILGFLDLLKDNFRNYNTEEIEQELGYIYDAAKNHFNLLEDLLSWTISNSGRLPFNPSRLNLHKVCTSSVEALVFHAHKKQISLQILVDRQTQLEADEDMLKTIIRNLVSNAIKFCKEGGSIRINCEQVAPNFEISVTDNGVGIEKERLTKLFEPIRCNTTRGTDGEKGTGLGLLLCKEFVERHGGRIWVTSEKDEGSEFKFTIPMKQTD